MSKIMEEYRKEIIREYTIEQISKKLKRGFTPEKIHEDDEYPMELILEVQKELLSAE